MTKVKAKVRLRKRATTFGELSNGKKWELLNYYIDNPTSTEEEIAIHFNLENSSSRRAIEKLYHDFVQTKETKALINDSKADFKYNQAKPCSYRHPSYINEEFLKKLSISEYEVSEAEHTYSYIYTFTGNNRKALVESGLDIGISKGSKVGSSNKTQLFLLRGHYLRQLPRIKKLINELRESKLQDLNIDRPMVQSEIQMLLDELKEEGNPSTLQARIRLIELQGKSVGAFQEVIKFDKVDPDKALSIVLARAKEAEIKKLGQGSDTDETWEMIGEASIDD